jgi:hypothetical protein
MKLLIRLIVMISMLANNSCSSQKTVIDTSDLSSFFTKRDFIILQEAVHLQQQLGSKVFPDWQQLRFDQIPLLYKKGKIDYLINHPNPPIEFNKQFNSILNYSLFIKMNVEPQQEVQASFDINGIKTIAITSPSTSNNPCVWALKFVHEMFHLFQGEMRVINPFIGKYASTHELSFPFPFADESIMASFRVESEFIFRLINDDTLSTADSVVIPKVFNNLLKVQKKLYDDSLSLAYKQWMEWSEGVARYCERELALLAYNDQKYTPTAAFVKEFKCGYRDSIVVEHYARMINPIRFVGEGVKGRTMFYYSGMGKAYLLDKIKPGWRTMYLKRNLDELIISNNVN